MIAVFDVGATSLRIGLSDDGKTLVQKELHPTITTKDGWAKALTEAQKLDGTATITSAAAGLPGLIDASGTFYNPSNLSEWNGLQVVAPLQKLVGPKGIARVENDTALVGLGEAYFGTGTTKGIMAYVTVSTGVNGVRIVDGQIDRHAKGFEIGRQLIFEQADKWVTLQNLIGGHHLQEEFGRLPSRVDDPNVWKTETRYLAAGLYNLMLHWSPDVIVLGGSIMRDLSLDRVQAELEALPPVFDALPELRPATLGEWGGLYGGLALLNRSK